MSWAAWDPAPLVLGAAAVGLWRFWHGFLRLRRRGRRDLAGWDRAVLSTAQRLAFAGGLFACGQLLADVLFLAGPLYPAYGSSADQQLAGLVMMVEQTVALGLFASFVLRELITASSRRSARLPATA